jgi:eukaryotic-like serine/threonine-protein kinase
MQVACPRCRTVLDYSSQPSAFCSQCGCALTPQAIGPTEAFDPNATEPHSPLSARQPDLPHAEVGGYRLLRPLGSGGMGTVYEAEDPASGRRVALKLISSAYAGSTEAAERFRREGRLASTLVHPRCVFVFATDEEDGRPYLIMELMPGRTLEDIVSEQGPMEPGLAVTRILDVLDGLQEAHRLGFIHRDVKPSNCFLDAEGRVKIGDFGLARSVSVGERSAMSLKTASVRIVSGSFWSS